MIRIVVCAVMGAVGSLVAGYPGIAVAAVLYLLHRSLLGAVVAVLYLLSGRLSGNRIG